MATSHTVIRDSGNRRKFSTGAQRDRKYGKGLPNLSSPIANRRLYRHFEAGAKKYSDRNWEQGMPVAEFVNSAYRHLEAYREGCRIEDHLAAALWNIHCAIHTEEMAIRGVLPRELLDGLTRYFPDKCKKHPRYMASNPPKVTCKHCALIYAWKKYYENDPENWI